MRIGKDSAVVGVISEIAEVRLSRKLTDDEVDKIVVAVNERGGMPVWTDIREAQDVYAYIQELGKKS
jgi:hypothetical protein